MKVVICVITEDMSDTLDTIDYSKGENVALCLFLEAEGQGDGYKPPRLLISGDRISCISRCGEPVNVKSSVQFFAGENLQEAALHALEFAKRNYHKVVEFGEVAYPIVYLPGWSNL